MTERDEFLKDFGEIVERLEKAFGEPPSCFHCYDTGYTDWFVAPYGGSPHQSCNRCGVYDGRTHDGA